MRIGILGKRGRSIRRGFAERPARHEPWSRKMLGCGTGDCSPGNKRRVVDENWASEFPIKFRIQKVQKVMRGRDSRALRDTTGRFKHGRADGSVTSCDALKVIAVAKDIGITPTKKCSTYTKRKIVQRNALPVAWVTSAPTKNAVFLALLSHLLSLFRVLSRLGGVLLLLLFPQLALAVGLVLLNVGLGQLDGGGGASEHVDDVGGFGGQ